MSDLLYTVFVEVNALGTERYVVQGVDPNGVERPEPFTWEFRTRKAAERFAEKRNWERLRNTYRRVES